MSVLHLSLPENMALSMVSCFVRVPIVVLKREPPTFSFTYIDGAPLITPPEAVAAADVANRGETAEFAGAGGGMP